MVETVSTTTDILDLDLSVSLRNGSDNEKNEMSGVEETSRGNNGGGNLFTRAFGNLLAGRGGEEEGEAEGPNSPVPDDVVDNINHIDATMGGSIIDAVNAANTDANNDDAKIEAVRQQAAIDGSLGHAGVEDFIAKELTAMSLNERERAFEDIHGVSSEVVETPELISTKLLELEDALDGLERQYPEPYDEVGMTANQLRRRLESIPRPVYFNPPKTLSVETLRPYRLAKKLNHEYITSSRLRLQFLRCESFDVQPAAARMMKFFQGKYHFFGAETLGRPLFYSDLSDDAKKVLEHGAFQLLEQRDSVGRCVLFDLFPIVSSPSGTLPLGGIARAIIYVVLAAVEDELTQRNGLVLIQYYIGQLTLVESHQVAHDLDPAFVHLIKEGSSIWQWLPLHFAACHQCINAFFLRTLSKLLMLDSGRTRRIRTRSHHGSHNEVQYSLMSFGLPVDIFPLTYDGAVKVTQQAKWITRRKIRDREIQQNRAFCGVELPSRDDILFGRGRKYQFHPGNNKMRVLVRELYPQYSQLSKLQKVEMAWTVTMELKKTCRFLKQDAGNGYWMPVPDDEAQKKVAVAFRKPQLHEQDTTIGAQTPRPVSSPSHEGGVSDSNDESAEIVQPTKKLGMTSV
mmetsp:Transcript_31817/g.77244  ORF Transcript_31817/g.77244 Transcript_31817/m.77244 type:complete len:627 (+) Transcript_31817:230-2110(+)